MDDIKYEVDPNDTMKLVPPRQCNLTFHDADQKQVGMFYLKDDQLHFEGDVTEAGAIFIDFLKRCWGKSSDSD